MRKLSKRMHKMHFYNRHAGITKSCTSMNQIYNTSVTFTRVKSPAHAPGIPRA